jgi:hypothetical protein
VNPLQIVEAARPEVRPIPNVARNHLRERLFDVASPRPRPAIATVTSPNSTRANALRLGALVLLGLVGVGGLAYSASRGTGETGPVAPADTSRITIALEPEPAPVVEAPRPTTAPTTTAAPIAGSADTPLLLPPHRTRLDQLSVIRKQLGGSSLLLRAPDLTTISLREADGLAPVAPEPPTTEVVPDAEPVETIAPPRAFGDIVVTLPGDPGTYDVRVPCGSLELREGDGFLPFRPEVSALFESMSIVDGSIDIVLPDGWTVIDQGPAADEFLLGIPLDIAGRTVSVTLAQYPDGNLAVAGFASGQFGPATFRGQPAWISRDPEVPGKFEVIGMLGTTAFRVGARDIALTELEGAMATLIPGDVDDWIDRFGTLTATADPDVRVCQEQPTFNVIQP